MWVQRSKNNDASLHTLADSYHSIAELYHSMGCLLRGSPDIYYFQL